MDNYDFFAEKLFSFLPLIILSVFTVFLLLPNSRKRFLKIQASLPTSKIHSIAIGLVEIQGKLVMKEPLISPVAKQECIGYQLVVEDITKDKNGKNSYSIFHKETQCNIFCIQDESGIIQIEPNGIELILLRETTINLEGNKRYTETLLQNGQEMLLVGYADSRNGNSFIRKDTSKNILGITSASGISVWNKYQQLLKSFLFTCLVILIVIIFILIK